MKTAFRLFLLLAYIFAVSACGFVAPSASAIEEAIRATQAVWTAMPSQTPYPSLTAAPTYTARIVVQTKIVTPTFTATPVFTATETGTPAPPTATPNVAQTATASVLAMLRSPKENGFYLVNVDIAPGVWRSDGTNDDCYWEITEADGDIIDNHFGMAGGTASIPASAFQVQFDDCGTWTFIQ